jgi:hypothetical protein
MFHVCNQFALSGSSIEQSRVLVADIIEGYETDHVHIFDSFLFLQLRGTFFVLNMPYEYKWSLRFYSTGGFSCCRKE